MTTGLDFDKELDVRGLACPLPVIHTRKALNDLQSGQTLRVLSSDPAADSDFRALVHAIGLELLSREFQNGELNLLIRKP